MTNEKREEIKKLAEIAFNARVKYINECNMNTPHEMEARKASSVSFALIRAELFEADALLKKAIEQL